ncbi:MAG: sulfatase-like hydrolase/transferase [Verrucomicrobiales bacterium]|nr:sulfatase-like hydrolase/transferase [Verrucomicrobiales bacterium]
MTRLGLLFLLFLAPLAAADPRPNVLLILADDLRPDYGGARTPHLDELAARGMTFTRATCSYPICVVSRTEILTGLHGWERERDLPLWPEAFRAAGYRTWHVGKWHVGGRPADRGYSEVAGHFASGGGAWVVPGQRDWEGFPVTGYRGWIFQSGDGREKYPDLGVGLTPDISRRFADAAISLIDRKGDVPWFGQLDFTAPHDPLFMPPGLEGKYPPETRELPPDFLPEHPFDHGNFTGRDELLLDWPRTGDAVRRLLSVYAAVVDDLDAQIGRVLAALEQSGQRDRTLVIFSSDHGMACGSHGLRGKQNQYEHTIGVPFIAAGPGIPAGRRSEAQIYLRELYPTTAEMAGVPVPARLAAGSFAPVLRGEKAGHHEAIHGYFTDTQRMIRTADGWKLIRYPQVDRWQLFDLTNDPHERRDLSSDPAHRARFEDLRARLATWRREAGDPLDRE